MTTPAANAYDVIVVGGGPAGSTTATLVADSGHRVLLLERETTPQFQVGESLMPGTYWTFERLGMLESSARAPSRGSSASSSSDARAWAQRHSTFATTIPTRAR